MVIQAKVNKTRQIKGYAGAKVKLQECKKKVEQKKNTKCNSILQLNLVKEVGVARFSL